MSDYIFVDMPPPLHNSKWVKIRVEIVKNETGEAVSYMDETLYNGLESLLWVWTDGNFSCDCNRRIFFQREKGEKYDDDSECTDGEYSIRIINPKNGEVLYDEIGRNEES